MFGGANVVQHTGAGTMCNYTLFLTPLQTLSLIAK